ncbi:hypothetical protein SAPIO_CDS8517 [Scedosporium apiospermum]|uniref:CFEM domain-containing protein n=1 Tax=Pseudallescheria apiosperma TaxID=563466 RepID=A0A084FZU0_PSEDA|nr:uncharacterized protein SAPIO_CDS8517 [Scedosporium apiospermum]KEZ40602.1 hypothetical protein SAPIO_CDS8517 [Scedosporium apiospermum]
MAKCKLLVRGLAWALTLGVAVAQLESLDACALGCISGLRDKANTFGCEIGATTCMCTSPEFAASARDCAQQSCGQVDQINNFSATFCAAQAPPTPTPTPAPEPTQAEPAPTSTVERPTPEQAPQSSATEASSSETTSAPTETTSATAPAATTSSATTSSAAGAGGSEPSNDDSDNDEKDKKEEEDNSSNGGASGLSLAAKAGIGVSVGVVGLSVILLAVLLLLRRRRAKNGRRLNSSGYSISGPMPGSGRDYADSHSDFGKEHNGSELEMTSRRYEDMLPRAQPASVI